MPSTRAALAGVLKPGASEGPFNGPRYRIDGFCLGCGEPKPSTHNTWTPLGLLCIACRQHRHGITVERNPFFGDFWMWWCDACGGGGPVNTHIKHLKRYTYVARSFKLHQAKCPRPRTVIRSSNLLGVSA